MKITENFDPEKGTYNLHFDVEFTEEYKEKFKIFTDDYSLESIHFHPKKKPRLIAEKERKCRFCSKSYPEVEFESDAHILPQLIGNKFFISDFECDNCNSKFSAYEDSLAKFLGITRTVTYSKGKSGIPTFKNHDNKLVARKNKESEKPNAIKVEIYNPSKENIEWNKNTGNLTLKAIKHPYKPINVYKVLLKIALSFLSEVLLDKYDLCRKILLSDQYDKGLKGDPYFRLIGWFCPSAYFTDPMVIIWLKKDEKQKKNIPSRSMSLYFQNYIFQIFIPFYEDDKEINKMGNDINFKVIPPFVDKQAVEKFGEPTFFQLDLSDSEVKKDEKHSVTILFNEEMAK